MSLLLALPASPCLAQFVRVPVVRVPAVRPMVPHVAPVHGTGQSGGGGWSDGIWEKLAWGAGGVAAVGGIWWGVRRWRRQVTPRALVRIRSMPPGEAPEWVRSAWVGLELPLIIGQVHPENGPAQQAVSRLPVSVPDGYAVDGKTAVEILTSANAEAGQWWRDNAPDVLASGSQMVFPSHVCERLDDLGQVMVDRS